MQKVAILGSSGMLGSMVKRVFEVYGDFKVVAPSREELDAEYATNNMIENVLGDVDWVINCIGIIKPNINENNQEDILRAIRVNSIFPNQLAQTKYKIIQIETDCVFSGTVGFYKETDPHDPTDVYGKTKSLGEVKRPGYYHIRTSIIGPNGPKSLFDWVLNQPKNAKIDGYTTHSWNGVTTMDFASLCVHAVMGNVELKESQHFLPAKMVSKFELVKLIAEIFDRKDITLNPKMIKPFILRTLETNDKKHLDGLWLGMGYKEIPTVETMLRELKIYIK